MQRTISPPDSPSVQLNFTTNTIYQQNSAVVSFIVELKPGNEPEPSQVLYNVGSTGTPPHTVRDTEQSRPVKVLKSGELNQYKMEKAGELNLVSLQEAVTAFHQSQEEAELGINQVTVYIDAEV